MGELGELWAGCFGVFSFEQASGHTGHYRCVKHGYCMTDGSGHFRGRPERCTTTGHRGVGCILCPVPGHKWSCCNGDFGQACLGTGLQYSSTVVRALIPLVCS